MNHSTESKKTPGKVISLRKAPTLLDQGQNADTATADDEGNIWLETDDVSFDFMNDREQPEDQQR